jgi:hypothetical protein
VSTGTGIVDSKFNCAIEEIKNATQGAGGLGFTSYDDPAVAFGVLMLMTVAAIAAVMILLKRRDSV